MNNALYKCCINNIYSLFITNSSSNCIGIACDIDLSYAAKKDLLVFNENNNYYTFSNSHREFVKPTLNLHFSALQWCKTRCHSVTLSITNKPQWLLISLRNRIEVIGTFHHINKISLCI